MNMPSQQTIDPQHAQGWRRWLRPKFTFSLRALLLAVTLASVGLGIVVHRTGQQRQAVATIHAAGGSVMYDYGGFSCEDPQVSILTINGELPGPDWLCRLIGVDYFANVVSVSLMASDASDSTLTQLCELRNLQRLDLTLSEVSDSGLAHLIMLERLRELHLNRTEVTDEGIVHLRYLSSLQILDLSDTQVTDEGLLRLRGLRDLRWLCLNGLVVSETGRRLIQASLPNCSIVRD